MGNRNIRANPDTVYYDYGQTENDQPD